MENEPEPAAFLNDPPAACAELDPLDRRELAIVAIERTRMPMVVTDPRRPDNPIVLANQAYLDLTGYSAREVLGRNCRFLQGPETDPAALQIIRAGLASEADVVVTEVLNYRKDGSTFWNDLSITPVRDARGTVVFHLGSQKDVSEKRRADQLERTEHRLLGEVDHRAMNALALVQSIVSLSQVDDAERFARSVKGRVAALAGAHRLLAQSGWRGADLASVLFQGAQRPNDGRIVLDPPERMVSGGLVQPLALVLHELVTNACQHGALSGPDGTVVIRTEDTLGRLSIEWTETASRSIPARTSSGAGFRLITGIVVYQLGGSFDLEWRGAGLQARLVVGTSA